VDWGGLRRMEPVSREFGYDRGTPVDRYYIDRFLRRNSSAVFGRVLEVGDDSYTRQFGGERVTRRDVFHVQTGTLYPALQRLLRRGWIAAEWSTTDAGRRARYYRLTTAGRKHLETERASWERASLAVRRIMSAES